MMRSSNNAPLNFSFNFIKNFFSIGDNKVTIPRDLVQSNLKLSTGGILLINPSSGVDGHLLIDSEA